MKKFFALVLIACMMMTAALAEAAPVQDQQPPKAVVTVNEAGESIVARVYDALGNEIAQVKEEELVLTDVHFRKEAENAAVAECLTAALEGVLAMVHFSDAACSLHEHAVKEDINAVLAAMEDDFDAYDLVMTEMFAIMPSEAVCAMLTDGAYMEITFEAAPLLPLFTADGEKWALPEGEAGAEGYTVKLTQPGVMAMLADGRADVTYVEEITEETVETVIEGEDAGSMDVHFDNFTPSVSGKDAPEMVPFPGFEGEDAVACIRNQSGELVALVPNNDYIIVTAVSESMNTADIQTYEQLESNFGDVMNAENVGALTSDTHEGTIAAELDAALQAMNLDLTCEQLVVKDLFEVTAYGDYVDYMYGEGVYLEVIFDADLDPSKPLVVIHSADGVNWHVHSGDDVTVNADGTVTLKLAKLGTIAFLVEAETEPDAETAVQSPN